MSEGLKTYSGIVTTVADAEIGSTGNEKPRRVVIKQDLNEQYGKTFRIWSNHDDFGNLVMGHPITVEYVEVPNRDPSRKPSNMIQAAWQDSEGGANGTSAAHTSGAPTGTAPPSGTADDDPPNPLNAAPSFAQTKDDYREQKEAKDEDRNRRMAVAWAISQSIALGHTAPEDLHKTAHNLLVLQDRIVSELVSGW